MTRYNSHRQERRWSYPLEKTACQSDLRFKSYQLLHNVTCERFDGVYGQWKPGINSLLISRWKPSITWQKTLFLMIASTNSTRAAAAKSLFRAKCRCLKGSVLVARKMNSGRACCSSGRVFSMLSQWRTRARADGAPSVAVCRNFNTMTGPRQPTWVPHCVRLVPAVVELLAFSNHDTRTDGHTTDGHNVINNIDCTG